MEGEEAASEEATELKAKAASVAREEEASEAVREWKEKAGSMPRE